MDDLEDLKKEDKYNITGVKDWHNSYGRRVPTVVDEVKVDTAYICLGDDGTVQVWTDDYAYFDIEHAPQFAAELMKIYWAWCKAQKPRRED